MDTALHASKDFAVSLFLLPRRFTHKGCPPLSVWTSLLAPLWLPTTGVTRYPAPTKVGRARTFLTLLLERDHPMRTGYIMTHIHTVATYCSVAWVPVAMPFSRAKKAGTSRTYCAGVSGEKC